MQRCQSKFCHQIWSVFILFVYLASQMGRHNRRLHNYMTRVLIVYAFEEGHLGGQQGTGLKSKDRYLLNNATCQVLG